MAQWLQFLSYISGKASQAEMDGTRTGRSLRRDLAWCWNVPVPKPVPTGEIYEQVFLDGTQIAYGWTLLVAVNQAGKAVSWQWAASENTAAYEWLIKDISPPDVATIDGAKGALSAINTYWPQYTDKLGVEGGVSTRIQRCLLHVHRNNLRDLTQNPQTMAGKALLALSKRLLSIETTGQAGAWEALLQAFYDEFADYLKERTYAKDDPEEARRRGRTWWYTHQRDRSVYHRFARLARKGVLFTYIEAGQNRSNLHKTTNIVESTNAGISNLCLQHRGLSESHLICAIEWHLLLKSEDPPDPAEILKAWIKQGRPTARILPRKHKREPRREGPPEYDTHTSAEEGLWTRKGWAGRSL